MADRKVQKHLDVAEQIRTLSIVKAALRHLVSPAMLTLLSLQKKSRSLLELRPSGS